MWPPRLNDQKKDLLLQQAIDRACATGILMRETDGKTMHHAPFALFPSPFPRNLFYRAVRLQPAINLLIHHLSLDTQFLTSVYTKLSEADPFSQSLFRVFQQLQTTPSHQKVTLGIHRSDYMRHHDADLFQVEINTIAASFASLSTKVAMLHRYLTERFEYFNGETEEMDVTVDKLPDNKALEGIVEALATAHKSYVATIEASASSSRVRIVMVVQPGERNVFDQRCIEHLLFEKHGIKMIRRTFHDIATQATLEGLERRLLLQDSEASVVYFRAGYGPEDYPDDQAWSARSVIEQSFAIKCPNIAYHMVGAKKIQQLLADPNVVEKYVSKETAEQIRACFTGLHSLDKGVDGDKAVEMALKNPEKYVLKPQREGGGHNIYGKDIVRELSRMSDDERSGYILMELIEPPALCNCLVRRSEAVEAEVVSELGFDRDGEMTVVNASVGHLLRTKTTTTNEGGVAAGFAVLDSPMLV